MSRLAIHGCLFCLPCLTHAAGSIAPSFEGAFGATLLSSGTASVTTSGPQIGAMILSAGTKVIQSGFLSHLLGSLVSQVVAPGQIVTQTVTTGAGPVTLSIPAGALPAGTAVVLQLPAEVPANASGSNLVSVANSAVEILAGGAQPTASARCTFSFTNANVAGLNPSLFVVARYNTLTRTWVPLASTVDTANREVMVSIDHFSLFQIMQSNPSSTLSTVKVFPNPFRPALGHQAMNFISLPANSRIRIYGLKGRLVKELTANGSGMAIWDGTNQWGSPAASGVYFVFAQGAGEKRTFNVAIQR